MSRFLLSCIERVAPEYITLHPGYLCVALSFDEVPGLEMGAREGTLFLYIAPDAGCFCVDFNTEDRESDLFFKNSDTWFLSQFKIGAPLWLDYSAEDELSRAIRFIASFLGRPCENRESTNVSLERFDCRRPLELVSLDSKDYSGMLLPLLGAIAEESTENSGFNYFRLSPNVLLDGDAMPGTFVVVHSPKGQLLVAWEGDSVCTLGVLKREASYRSLYEGIQEAVLKASEPIREEACLLIRQTIERLGCLDLPQAARPLLWEIEDLLDRIV